MDNPPPTTTNIPCDLCDSTDADIVEFHWGPVVLASPTLCDACADDYDPPAPSRWDRMTAGR